MLADELYKLYGDDYRFVATMPLNEEQNKGGEDYSTRSYCILAGESEQYRKLAYKYAVESDVCVFGACSQDYAVARAIKNPKGLSFEMAERWLKHGVFSLLSPTLIKWMHNYVRYYRKANFFKLCAGAYVSQDDRKLFAYKGKHFKWGYFLKIDEKLDLDMRVCGNSYIRIMWCGRFIKWKHPEMAISLAQSLKNKGYSFHIDMYGEGSLKCFLQRKIDRLHLNSYITLKGFLPNTLIQQEMQRSDIFILTSDQHEGWGAVANEAMSNGCVLVASNLVGSAPYLIDDGVNGFCFENLNTASMVNRVEWLILHPVEKKKMQYQAYETIHSLWSPMQAAKRLANLIDYLQQGLVPKGFYGPCSIA